MTVRAYVGIGANLGDPVAQVLAAIEALAALPGTTLAAASSLYRTAPVGAPDQPDYVNAVAALDTHLDPHELLDALQRIEQVAGRDRPFPNAPRTLDLDLLTYAAQHLADDRLTLPHPRMHERAFVLAPLVEICPDAGIPGLGRAVDWLARSEDQRVAKIVA